MASNLEQTSDDSLVARIAAGQADAFTTLFRRRQADVYRFALHLTGSPAIAEDVTQDVFLILMREAGRYQAGRSSVAAWLCGVARNCARQRLARDRDHRSVDGSADGDGRWPAVHPDPVGDLARAERVACLRKALLALPVRYREVVVLCDLQELSYAEAADVLGCALGTVRSRLHRARSLLAGRVARLEALPSRGAASGSVPQTVRREDRPRGPSQKRCLA